MKKMRDHMMRIAKSAFRKLKTHSVRFLIAVDLEGLATSRGLHAVDAACSTPVLEDVQAGGALAHDTEDQARSEEKWSYECSMAGVGKKRTS